MSFLPNRGQAGHPPAVESPSATRLGDNAQVGKGRPGIPCPRYHSIVRLLAYIMQTQLGTFKDPTETTSLEPAKNKRSPHTISLARFCCYPPRPIYKADVALLCSPVRLVLHPHTHTSSTLALGRGTASIASFPSHSAPSATHRTNPLFYIQSLS